MNIAVIGVNRGVGLALAEHLLSEGHKVWGFCRKSSSALKELKNLNLIEEFEVTNYQALPDQLSQAQLEPLDFVFHVAGIMRDESLDNMNVETLREQFEVNAIAPVMTVQALLPYLKKGARIGLLTSRMGSIADNSSGGRYGYRMSKAALNMAGKSLAEDLKSQNFGVYLLHPGFVKTDMTQQQGLLTPSESAQALWDVMQKRSLEETGSFWHSNGEALPW